MTKYEKALLDTIAYAEGTLGVSNNGYDVTVAFKIINGWTEDTTIVHGGTNWNQFIKKIEKYSNAAGRYQFTFTTWTGSWIGGTKTAKGQNVPMTKSNQDIAAMYLIKTKRNVTQGEINNQANIDVFAKVMDKLANEWASLPKLDGSGAYVGQGGDKQVPELHDVYLKAFALY